MIPGDNIPLQKLHRILDGLKFRWGQKHDQIHCCKCGGWEIFMPTLPETNIAPKNGGFQ